jgi:hypothetical protein
VVVALVAEGLVAAVDPRWAGLRAVVFLDTAAAAECRGLLRAWVGRRAGWAVPACRARRREWGADLDWPMPPLRE